MNRYVQPMFVRPSGYAASNLIPWPAVTQNRDAIRYYQRVMLEKSPLSRDPSIPAAQRLREDGLWGPITQRWVTDMQAGLNREMSEVGDQAAYAKYGLTRLRTDGVLDEATQRTLQIVGQLNGVPRGSFPVGSAARPAATTTTTPAPSSSKPNLSPMNNYVGGGSSTPAVPPPAPVTTTSMVGPKASTPGAEPTPLVAPMNFTPAAPPAETAFPWGTAAIVGSVALLLGAGVWMTTTPRKGRR